MLDDRYKNNSLIDISNINVLLSGYVTSKGIEGHVAELKEFFNSNNVPVNVSNSIYSIFIELMNNVLMYSAEYIMYSAEYCINNSDKQKGHFLFGEDNEMFILQSINHIEDSNIDFVEKKINFLNKMNKRELRKYYKECIKSENLNPESKGAGLGLIDIAKHSDTPIKYMFKSQDNGFSLFTMLVKVNKGVKT